MCALYLALINTVPVPGCEQAELSCVLLISLQENESGLCCWTCTAGFLSPRVRGTLDICIDICLEMLFVPSQMELFSAAQPGWRFRAS